MTRYFRQTLTPDACATLDIALRAHLTYEMDLYAANIANGVPADDEEMVHAAHRIGTAETLVKLFATNPQIDVIVEVP